MGLSSMVQKYCTVQPLLWWRRKANTPTGKPQYEQNPHVVSCRWDQKQVEVIARDGRSVTSNAMIMSPFEIPVGSWVFQGTLAEWQAMTGTYPNVPTPQQGGYEIVSAGHNPGFRGEELLFTYFV